MPSSPWLVETPSHGEQIIPKRKRHFIREMDLDFQQRVIVKDVMVFLRVVWGTNKR